MALKGCKVQNEVGPPASYSDEKTNFVVRVDNDLHGGDSLPLDNGIDGLGTSLSDDAHDVWLVEVQSHDSSNFRFLSQIGLVIFDHDACHCASCF